MRRTVTGRSAALHFSLSTHVDRTGDDTSGAYARRPRQIGDITLASLMRYSGHDPALPLCFAVRGKVLDVTEGRDFYGPGADFVP